MKLAVEFPSVAYREGPAAIIQLAKAIEEIGYDQLDMFDHVVMGYPTSSRSAPMYPPKMPIMEALMVLSYVAAVTSTIGLGTEVLVLPQRQPTLVAKQISTLDTLSGGRVRLGVGVGWQKAEYEALGVDFENRGKRMDESIRLLRAFWGDSQIDFAGEFHHLEAIAMEPKPPQGNKLPIWIGGNSKRAFRRIGELGNGWLATSIVDPMVAKSSIEAIRRHTEEAGRNPDDIEFQQMLDLPPTEKSGKNFYADLDKVEARAIAVKEMGFEWGTVNATAIFQSGARSVDEIIDNLKLVHDRLRVATG
jgi:probable F420-dependent oxidoreductase